MASEQENRPGAVWQPLGAPALIGDPIVQCLILILLTSAVFVAFPGIDIWFSGLFYDPGNGFLVGRLKAFTAFRDLLRYLTVVIVVVCVVVLVLKPAWPYRKMLLEPRAIAYILGTLIVGPGIIVNLVFKDQWGRPRPYRVDVFGGDQPFVTVWRITKYCAANCSFVSGEGSSAIWLFTLLVLVPKRWRSQATWVIGVLALLLSLNRIAFGGHFLSDVLLAWWITLLIMAIAYRFLYINPSAALTNERMEAWLTEAGKGLRQGAGLLRQKIAERPARDGDITPPDDGGPPDAA